MYSVSNAYKQAIQADRISERVIGTVSLVNETIIDINDENLKENSLYITNQCTSSENLEIGAVVSAYMEMTLLDVSQNPYNMSGGIITLRYGVETSENVWEEVPLGQYVVSNVERNGNQITVGCYDNMIKFDKPVSGTLAGSLYSLVQSACTSCNVGLETTQSSFNTLPNGTLTVSNVDVSQIETWRDLLGWICQLTCTFAYIGRNGGLYFKKVSSGTSVYTLPIELQLNAKISDNFMGITGVSMEVGEESYFVGSDTHVMELDENPLLVGHTKTSINSILTNIKNSIELAEYHPISVDWYGDPCLDLWDWITIKEVDTLVGFSDVLAPIMSYTWHYQGKCNVSAVGETSLLRSDYSQSNKVIKAITQKVESVVVEVEDISDKASQAQATADTAADEALAAYQKAQQVESGLANMTIGVNNILTGTKDWSGTWVNSGSWTTNGTYKGFVVKTRTGQFLGLRILYNVIAGEKYTLSAFVKTAANANVTFFSGGGTGTTSGSPTVLGTYLNWTWVSHTFTATTTGTVSPRFENANSASGELSICAYYLTKGDKQPQTWQPAIEDTTTAIQTVSDLANTKGKVIIQSATPNISDRDPKNLWIDTTDGLNTPKYWNGTAWTVIQDKGIQDAANAAAEAYARANAAHTLAGTAQTTADTALASANSKTKVFHDTTVPVGNGTAIGDIWFQHNLTTWEILGQWSWSGTQWQQQQLNHTAIASLDLGKATVGHLTASQVRLENFETLSGKTKIDNNGKLITEELVATNADITAKITATSGTIGGWTIASSALTRNDDLGYMRLGGAGWAISIGSTTPANAPIRMTYDGYLYASNATISGNVTARRITNSENTSYAEIGAVGPYVGLRVRDSDDATFFGALKLVGGGTVLTTSGNIQFLNISSTLAVHRFPVNVTDPTYLYCDGGQTFLSLPKMAGGNILESGNFIRINSNNAFEVFENGSKIGVSTTIPANSKIVVRNGLVVGFN